MFYKRTGFSIGKLGEKMRLRQTGFSLISVIFVMLALSAIGIGLSSMISTHASASLADFQGQQAFYAAEAVLQSVMAQYFMYDTNYGDNSSPTGSLGSNPSISFGGAQVWVQYSNQSTYQTDITVTARVNGAERKVFQHVQQAVALNSPMFAGGNINIDTHPIINFCIFGWCVPSGKVNGPLAAGGTNTIAHPTTFTVTGTKTAGMQVAFPAVDVDPLIPLVTTSTHTGDLVIGPGANILNPAYYDQNVHVTGNVIINNNSVVNSRIVADGDITITGNVIVRGTMAAKGNISSGAEKLYNNAYIGPKVGPGPEYVDQQEGPNGEVLPVLMAEGDIAMNVNGVGVLIEGLVMAGDDLSFYADVGGEWDLGELFLINGALLAGGDMSLYNERGYVQVNGNSSLINQFSEAGSVKLQNWKEL
ncbi:MAG: hypothetical protein PHN49_00540 [Candidatus Omnitrophica bacterium]|nr:hypothetical protein [Candidatus Omnitrophota bacterium]MDD5670109.1 hypothetical protein [Candidatus Omnitrophota bacterium]